MKTKYLIDANGYIDDFCAPGGAVGHPVARHIMLYSEFKRILGTCLRELKDQKFDKQEVEKAIARLIDEVYDEGR